VEHPMVTEINRTGYPRHVRTSEESENMGDIADMILEGILCEECGSYIDDEEPGHLRKCEDCME
jgi:hypothetical protein